MIDLTVFTPEVLIARGSYSTVRSALEEEKKSLVALCEEVMRHTPMIVKHGQRDDDQQDAYDSLEYVRGVTVRLEQQLDKIKALSKQKAELKQAAWGKA